MFASSFRQNLQNVSHFYERTAGCNLFMFLLLCCWHSRVIQGDALYWKLLLKISKESVQQLMQNKGFGANGQRLELSSKSQLKQPGGLSECYAEEEQWNHRSFCECTSQKAEIGKLAILGPLDFLHLLEVTCQTEDQLVELPPSPHLHASEKEIC